MRLSSSNVLHKMNTRNQLTSSQMYKLHDLGLVVIADRDKHRECDFGVEELLQILPACIVSDGSLYSLRIYKNAFDVQCVAYYKNGDDWLYGVAVDDIPNPEYPNQSGHLVDAIYDVLLWVNDVFPEELAEYKEKVKHHHLAQ